MTFIPVTTQLYFQHHYCSVTWSFRNHSANLLLMKHFLLLSMLKTI